MEKQLAKRIRQNYAEIVKHEIVRTAARLFVKNGYNKTKMTDIAETVGMSKANLYNYIGKKDDLTFLIFEAYNQRTSAVINEINSLPMDISATEKLRKAIKSYSEVVNEYQEESIFLHHAVVRLNKEGRRKLISGLTKTFSFFADLLDEGIEAGEFRRCNNILVGANIADMCARWAHHRWFWRGFITLEEYIIQQTKSVESQILKDGESQ